MTEHRWTQSFSGIRGRIVIGYVALLASALAISILVMYQVLLARVDRDIDRALVQEIEELRLLAGGTDPETGEPFGDDAAAIFDTFLRRSVPGDDEAFYSFVGAEPYLSSFDAPQVVLEQSDLVDRWVAVDEPTRSVSDTELGELRSLAVPLVVSGEAAGVFVVGHFADNDRDEVVQIVRIALAAGAVMLLVSTALAWSISSRVLRPVRELTTTARAITETDMSRRIPVTGDDELGELGDTFNAMLDRLDDGFRSQRQFLDDVAHELRTPITIVQGHIDLLGDDPAERADTVAVITDELDRMNRYVSDLLVLAKAEEPTFLHSEPLDLGEFVDHLRPRLETLGDRHWVVDTAPRPGTVAILADHGRLTQAMLNLAANAVQHTVDGDEIGLGIAVGNHDDGHREARLWVRDTGPGIDPAIMDRLFQRTFRGAASRAQRADGAGIGLAILDVIVRAHGGHVSAENLAGGGAKFTISIPFEHTADSPHPEDT